MREVLGLNPLLLGLIIGLFTGAVLGVFAIAVVSVNRDAKLSESEWEVWLENKTETKGQRKHE